MVFNTWAYYLFFLVPSAILFRLSAPRYRPWVIVAGGSGFFFIFPIRNWRLFGIPIPEKFDWPYLQTNISMFWRHWHMSLTSWLTDIASAHLGSG